MGKLYAYAFVSLDGVVSDPERWTGPHFGEDLAEDLAKRLERCHAMVLGARTYEAFAAFWPGQPDDVPFARLNNTVRKLVVSRTRATADWQNATVVDLAGLAREREHGDLHVTGSGTLVRALIEERLLDELILHVFPVLRGEGQRLFEGGPPVTLRLVERTDRQRGVTSLTYALTEP